MCQRLCLGMQTLAQIDLRLFDDQADSMKDFEGSISLGLKWDCNFRQGVLPIEPCNDRLNNVPIDACEKWAKLEWMLGSSALVGGGAG